MRKKRKSYLWFFLLLAVGGGVFAYMQLTEEAPQVTYLTETVRRGDIRRTVNASGQVGAVQLVNVGAQASGQIERLYVEVGQQVKKGDMIAEIDSTTQENDLATSQAKLATFEAQLVSKEIALRVAKANYDREVKLRRSDSTSSKSLDDAESTYATAKAAVAELQSQILQTKISLNTAETNLGYTRITAPLDGTVVSVPVEEGQTVNANQTTPTIVQVADLSRMEIKIEIAEGDITKVQPGLPVEYSILSEPNMLFHTELRSIDPGLTTLSDGNYESSSSSSNAVYYYAKAVVDNQEGRLRIGMTTQNVIEVEKAENVLLAPSIAISKMRAGQAPENGPKAEGMPRPDKGPQGNAAGASSGVQRGTLRVLLPSGQVEQRVVELGISDNMNTEIKSGLSEGEQVITTQMGSNEAAPSAAAMRGPGMRR